MKSKSKTPAGQKGRQAAGRARGGAAGKKPGIGASKGAKAPAGRAGGGGKAHHKAAELLTLTETAERLQMEPSQLSRESERVGFPRRVIQGKTMLKLEEVIAWRAHNVRVRRKAEEMGSTTLTPAAAPPPGMVVAGAGTESCDELVRVLSSGTASALEISQAAMQLAAHKVAQGATQGVMGIDVMDDLKKALQELRQAEADYLELEKTRGQLIDRGDVVILVGTLASRLVQCVTNLENAIATEFAVWLADPAVAALPADERARRVREFVAAKCSEVRRQEAAGVEALLAEMQKEAAE